MIDERHLISKLKDRLSFLHERKYSFLKEDRLLYSYDARVKREEPIAVIWPEDKEDISRIMKTASALRIPVIPRGAGTGMTGGSVPIGRSIVLSLERMNRIIDIDTIEHTALVEPGVINGALQRLLCDYGFFYPPDPSSMDFSTIGGNVANNSGGPKALKYGVTKNYVMEMEVVLPQGEIINTGARTRKSVAGYNLKDLFIGSEGTLGVITKLRLKILPMPEITKTILIGLRTLNDLKNISERIFSTHLLPSAMEFMDAMSIKALRDYYMEVGILIPINTDGLEAIIIIEFDGNEDEVKKDIKRLLDLIKNHNVEIFLIENEERRDAIWRMRRAISPALYRLKPWKINEDIAVPRRMVVDFIERLQRIQDEMGIMIVNFGHMGDGNIHVNIMVDKEGSEEYIKGLEVVERIMRLAIDFGGTISGEHGIGITKSGFLPFERSEYNLRLMKEIKRIFDPLGILNPGKIFKV